MVKKNKQIKAMRGRPRLSRPGLKRLEKKGVFDVAEAERHGISESALKRLVAGGGF